MIYGIFRRSGTKLALKSTIRAELEDNSEIYASIHSLIWDSIICYQSGLLVDEPNMSVANFRSHKPAGQGTVENMLSVGDPRVARFFSLIDERHPFKVGMDSCNVPGAIRLCKSILPESLDTCEGGRNSCYIGADMMMVPCSFDQQKRYEVSLRDMTIEEASVER